LNQVVGAYAIVVMCKDEPNKLVAARKSSPLVLGIGKDNDFYVASDATPIVEYTKQVVYLNDGDIAILNEEKGLKLYDHDEDLQDPYIEELELHLEALEKGGYDHFMLKEIHEQPRSIEDCFRGRLNAQKGWVSLGGIKYYEDDIIKANRIVMVACGTSWHACLVGEYLFEDLARINVEVEYASEFRYRNPIINEGDIVLAISQSGETADTLAALRYCQGKAAHIWSVTNVAESSIARESDEDLPIYAGIEIGVASTKAFTCQLTVLLSLALKAASDRNQVKDHELQEILSAMQSLPTLINLALDQKDSLRLAANELAHASNILFLGRGLMFPLALEGALKLKEISYIHAEAYAAGELKHGPIALIDETIPIVVMAPQDRLFDKTLSNVQEVMARKGRILMITDPKGVNAAGQGLWKAIEMPHCHEIISPIIYAIPAQMLAYYTAVAKGTDVDQPRNLAKSVTVE
jgi:glucosamine--fructose-6-phosphate aminotransferase (isomerizing)